MVTVTTVVMLVSVIAISADDRGQGTVVVRDRHCFFRAAGDWRLGG